MDTVRLLAFYLPQFHPIPENDEWWGKGFTEWSNVVTATPQFRGHYQPHVPADLGFYDLRCPETRLLQAEYADTYGFDGFVYYHYWFNGRRLLNRPLDEVLATGQPSFPFCICWANENWTRRWDGWETDVLIKQTYSVADDLQHIRHLITYFRDPRYITVDGKPVLIVYRTELLPDAAATAEIWRNGAQSAGFPDLYLIRMENFEGGIYPSSIGFDAALEFAPNGRCLGRRVRKMRRGYLQNRVFRYEAVVERTLAQRVPEYKWFRMAFPSWDNYPRRQNIKQARIIHGSTPLQYQAYLEQVLNYSYRHFAGEERLAFVNAWNEWGEGCHIEPDQRWGLGYLEACREAVRRTQHMAGEGSPSLGGTGIVPD